MLVAPVMEAPDPYQAGVLAAVDSASKAKSSLAESRKMHVSRKERRKLAAQSRNKRPDDRILKRASLKEMESGGVLVVKKDTKPTVKQNRKKTVEQLKIAHVKIASMHERGKLSAEDCARMQNTITESIAKMVAMRSSNQVSTRKKTVGKTLDTGKRKASSAGVYANAKHHSRKVYVSPSQRRANKIEDGYRVNDLKRKTTLTVVGSVKVCKPVKNGVPMGRKDRLKLEYSSRKNLKMLQSLENSIEKAA